MSDSTTPFHARRLPLRPSLFPLLLVASFAVPATAFAAAERTWTPLVRGHVPAGESDGAAATSRGTIVVAPEAAELAAPPAPYLWSIAADGGRVIVGSGDSGEIWLVPEDGGAASVLYDASELQAQALAVSGKRLIAGLNPGARVIAIRDGKAVTLFDAEEEFVWAILPDAKGTAIHVGVGSPGRVYRVEPGKGTPASVVLESGDAHVRSLANGKDGRLLAGTDGRGLVMRQEKGDGRFVLFDAPRREISSISVAEDGTIWFAAIGAEETEAAAVATAPTPAPTPADPKKGPAGQLYKMRPDGFAELVWTAPGPSIHAVLARKSGALVATGDPAAVWSIDAGGGSRKVLEPSVGQVTALREHRDDVLVATANPSKVFRLRSKRSTVATFSGKPLDAGGFAHWGRLRWEATDADGAKIEIVTRSGNSAVPDESWSGWSKPVPARGGPVASPPARYLQWQVRLEPGRKSPAPELSDLQVIYRVENREPRVEWVFVEEPGVTIAPKADAPPDYTLPPENKPTAVRKELPSKRGFARGWRAMRWSATDPDGDDLLFDVLLRGEGETTWKLLVADLPESYTTWDAASLPDGRYEVKVVAKDHPVNGSKMGRSGERIHGPFENDNTPPKVEKVAVRSGARVRTLQATAADDGGVASASYSIDGGDWVLMSPDDGISDSARERFQAVLPALGSGEHTIVVRALDRAGNPGTGKFILR